ncbi:MAG: hypothetical protein AB7F49_30485 [Pseudorhodoplanes sp.]
MISLDFELMWGVRDHLSIREYGDAVLGVRTALPRLLRLFEQRGIAATWATVGMLMFDNRDELVEFFPRLKPGYVDRNLSPYGNFDEVGRNEAEDPYHFGLSMMMQIVNTPRQEIGTHTFSHYYCLEPQQDVDAFAADLDVAIASAKRLELSLKSIVFPRNQYDSAHLEACRARGIHVFRGNESHRFYRPSPKTGEKLPKRFGRLIDSYLDLTGHQGNHPQMTAGLFNVPASRFLRPFNSKLSFADPLRLRRITNAMAACAKQNLIYHIWFHPHNFGRNQDANFMFLTSVLDHFEMLRDELGWQSRSMAEAAACSRNGCL